MLVNVAGRIDNQLMAEVCGPVVDLETGDFCENASKIFIFIILAF